MTRTPLALVRDAACPPPGNPPGRLPLPSRSLCLERPSPPSSPRTTPPSLRALLRYPLPSGDTPPSTSYAPALAPLEYTIRWCSLLCLPPHLPALLCISRRVSLPYCVSPAASPCPTVHQLHRPGPLFNASIYPRAQKSTWRRAGVHATVRSVSEFPLKASMNKGSSVKKKGLQMTCLHLFDHRPGPAGRPLGG